MPGWKNIFAALRKDGISIAENSSPHPVGGGDISAAWRINTKSAAVFIKTEPVELLDMFEAEAEGLRELLGAKDIRVPEVLSCGATENDAYLAIEWIEFEQPTSDTEQLFGQQLAVLHRHCKERFGWHRDNTIGKTPQHNQWSDNWVDFFKCRRLDFQLKLASENGFNGELQLAGAYLSKNLALLFCDYQPSISLLHGDLWGGNWAAAKGQPVIFDPAVYYGDRESDIAMTKLFGSFGPKFYASYQDSWPMQTGYEDRLKLYQLYHVLNHLNLFGSAYLDRGIQLIREINLSISH